MCSSVRHPCRNDVFYTSEFITHRGAGYSTRLNVCILLRCSAQRHDQNVATGVNALSRFIPLMVAVLSQPENKKGAEFNPAPFLNDETE